LRFPVNQVYLTNNSEGERESKAEDESKLTGKEGLGSSPLFVSFTVITQWLPYLQSLAVVTQNMLVFLLCLLMQSSNVRNSYVLRSAKAYTMNAIFTVTALATILNLILQKT